MVMRVLALTNTVEPSLPLSQRMRATSRQRPGPMFLFRGTQRKLKRPFARTCRWAIGAEFCALRTETRTVREQNSITGQPRPRTVWMSARLTVLGEAVMDWLVRRPEIDPQKVGVTGTSFGSFFGTILAANEPRVAATAVISTCLEPGCHTIFEEASPTFKKRFMWMSNYTDESKFNEFVKTLTWEGHVEKIRNPYLVVAGEADELSPLEHTERMIRAMSGPRQLVIYADSRHSVGNVPAANLGPFPPTLVADWLMARLNGKPLRSERWLVESTGRVVKSTL